jgi:hypothetical protein
LTGTLARLRIVIKQNKKKKGRLCLVTAPHILAFHIIHGQEERETRANRDKKTGAE